MVDTLSVLVPSTSQTAMGPWAGPFTFVDFKHNRNRSTDKENKLMITKGEKGEREKLEVWD